MSETVFRGPGYVAGSLLDGRIETMDGPSLTYQGDGIPDCRFWPTRKDGLYPNRVPAILNSPYAVLCDNIPQASNVASIAAAANPVANTPFTLSAGALAQANGTTAGNPTMSPGVPLIPMSMGSNGAFQWSGSPVSVLALDFGYTTGTTTTGGTSTTITVPDSTQFYPGQWIYVGGAGNSGKTIPLLTQVLALASATTITVSIGAAAAITNAPIGNANMPGPLPFQATGAPGVYQPSSVQPYFNSGTGIGVFLNPPECVARCLSATAAASAVANNITFAGYDVFGQKLTDTVAISAGATVFTLKAFKYLVSVTPSATDGSHTISIGTSDTYGFNLRSDKWEYTSTLWNGAFLTASTGWRAGIKTNPATALTGDVRGTFQLSTSATTGGDNGGAGGAGATATASNGSTVRLMMAMTIPLYNDTFATPQNPAPLFGVQQF
jgi:hypothetical protein